MLYSGQMKKILDKFGIDTSNLPDNLYSTLLDAIYNANVSSGGGDTPTPSFCDDLYNFYDVDKTVYPTIAINVTNSGYLCFLFVKNVDGLKLLTGRYCTKSSMPINTTTPIDDLINMIKSKVSASDFKESNTNYMAEIRNENNSVWYTNNTNLKSNVITYIT